MQGQRVRRLQRGGIRSLIILAGGGGIAIVLAFGAFRAMRPARPDPRDAPASIPASVVSLQGEDNGTPSGQPVAVDHQPVPRPRALQPGRSIEDLSDGETPLGELTESQRRELDKILERAERSDVAQLVDDVLASSRARDGRQLHYHAWLLAWAISRDPGLLGRLKGLLLGKSTSERDARNLLVSIGMAGTPESKATLLQWLDDPSLEAYEAAILEALHQTPSKDRWVMESQYGQLLAPDPRPWPRDLASISVCADRPVLEATTRRLGADTPIRVRQVASKILCRVNRPGGPPLDEDLRKVMNDAFWSMFRDEPDRAVRQAASYYVSNISDPKIHAQVWEMYSAEPADSLRRATYARILAQQSTSVEGATRVLEAMRRDPVPLVRKCFLDALRFEDRSPQDRKVIAEQVALWAPSEADEDVRRLAVERLEYLLPESIDQFGWATRDPSAVVRARAEIAIQASKTRTRPNGD